MKRRGFIGGLCAGITALFTGKAVNGRRINAYEEAVKQLQLPRYDEQRAPLPEPSWRVHRMNGRLIVDSCRLYRMGADGMRRLDKWTDQQVGDRILCTETQHTKNGTLLRRILAYKVLEAPKVTATMLSVLYCPISLDELARQLLEKTVTVPWNQLA